MTTSSGVLVVKVCRKTKNGLITNDQVNRHQYFKWYLVTIIRKAKIQIRTYKKPDHVISKAGQEPREPGQVASIT
jgi:hypothetical protein